MTWFDELPGAEPRSAEVSVLGSDDERGIFFWQMHTVQLCSHVTRFTPNWCHEHGWAFDRFCPPCTS